MEAAIVLAVIAVIMIILGVSGLTVMKGLLAILGIALALMTVFFTVSAALLLFSRRCKGEFVRIEKSKRYETAVYRIDGEELSCFFPAEPIMRGIIYRPGERTLFLCRRSKRDFVFDMHSALIIALGMSLSAASLGALIYTALMIGGV